MTYLKKIRQTSPHIYSIMNEVASNFTANGIIAIGASPSISNMPDEAEESGRNADAVILNAGTLSQERARAMLLAGERSEEHTSELQSRGQLVCRLLLENKKKAMARAI